MNDGPVTVYRTGIREYDGVADLLLRAGLHPQRLEEANEYAQYAGGWTAKVTVAVPAEEVAEAASVLAAWEAGQKERVARISRRFSTFWALLILPPLAIGLSFTALFLLGLGNRTVWTAFWLAVLVWVAYTVALLVLAALTGAEPLESGSDAASGGEGDDVAPDAGDVDGPEPGDVEDDLPPEVAEREPDDADDQQCGRMET